MAANPTARKLSMSWMIAELIGNINDLEYGQRKTTYSNVLFPEPAIRSTSQQYNRRGAVRAADVCHVSTVTTLSISNLPICCSERTTFRFLYGDLSKRCGDSLKGQEERANVGHPFGIGHLQRWFQSRQMRIEKAGKQTFHLVHFVYDLLKRDYNPL
jgi:hypothetical protein